MDRRAEKRARRIAANSEIAISRLQDEVTALAFPLGATRSPAQIVIGARDTYDSLDAGWKSNNAVEGKKRVPCRDHDDGRRTVVLVTLGQSNAANHGAGRYVAKDVVANFNLYDGHCYEAADPLLGASGQEGNFATRLGDLLVERAVAGRVVLAPIAMGGTTVEQWAREGLFNRRITVLLRRLFDAQLSPDFIVWHQGEGNLGIVDAGGRQYRKNLLEVVHTFRAYGIAAPFFIAQATRCGPGTHPTAVNIRAGQRAAVNAAIGTFLGPDTDLIGQEHRHDTCHMSESGLVLHAAAWADVLSRHKGVTTNAAWRLHDRF